MKVKKINSFAYSVGPSVVYGAIQEFGGVIKPKNTNLLKWKNENGWHSAKQVVIKGKHYMSKSLADFEQVGIDYFANALKRMVER